MLKILFLMKFLTFSKNLRYFLYNLRLPISLLKFYMCALRISCNCPGCITRRNRNKVMNVSNDCNSAIINKTKPIQESKQTNSYLKSKANFNIESKKFNEALNELNATLLSNMLEPIYENIEPDSLTGGGFAEETLNHFLVNEYAREITKDGNFKIDPNLNKQLLKKYQNHG